eukprot:TRINITY_DN34879_c0_g1_i4.p2 TRINITY_DN34879_c0_g1~~TRINITY_DN34879_c0_g1_i4.p2  ORF type:complete len:443 (-),score=141.76 TRINITY_DN34879_c0_g1_i4:207-1535(-)
MPPLGRLDGSLSAPLLRQQKPGISPASQAKMKSAFAKYDKDGSGSLEKAELRKALATLGERPAEKQFDALLQAIDSSGNGSLDFNEFLLLVDEVVKEKMARGPSEVVLAEDLESQSQWKFLTISILLFIAYWVVGVWFGVTRQGWSVISCTYFIVVTLTTVGYGDEDFLIGGKNEETSDADKYLGAIYVFVGVVFISAAAGVILDELSTRAQEAMEKLLRKKTQEAAAQGVGATMEVMDADVEIRKLYRKLAFVEIPKIIATLALGTFAMMELEQWALPDAFYFSCVTMTTVGYGDLTPKSDTTKLFLTFYILLAFGVIASSVAFLGSIPFETRRIRNFCKVLNQFGDALDPSELEALMQSAEVRALRTQNQQLMRPRDEVSRAEFVIWQLIKQQKVDLEEDVQPVLGIFDQLDTDGSGVLNQEDISLYLENLLAGDDAGEV